MQQGCEPLGAVLTHPTQPRPLQLSWHHSHLPLRGLVRTPHLVKDAWLIWVELSYPLPVLCLLQKLETRRPGHRC